MLGIRLLLSFMMAARQDFAGSRNAAAAIRQNAATWKTARRRRHGKTATTRQDGNGKTTRQQDGDGNGDGKMARARQNR
jgi:hypothetical protein